jgi:hypothetical protein
LVDWDSIRQSFRDEILAGYMVLLMGAGDAL